MQIGNLKVVEEQRLNPLPPSLTHTPTHEMKHYNHSPANLKNIFSLIPKEILNLKYKRAMTGFIIWPTLNITHNCKPC